MTLSLWLLVARVVVLGATLSGILRALKKLKLTGFVAKVRHALLPVLPLLLGAAFGAIPMVFPATLDVGVGEPVQVAFVWRVLLGLLAGVGSDKAYALLNRTVWARDGRVGQALGDGGGEEGDPTP